MQSGRGEWRARAFGALAVLGAAVLVSLPVAGADVEVENLRVGFAGNTQNNLFKIGTWTPVWVQLRGGSERFTGMMEVEVPDDDGTSTYFRQVVDVPAGSGSQVVTYARPGSRDPNFTIRLFDQQGRRRGEAVAGSKLAQLNPVQPDEALLLTLGRPHGVDQVPALAGFSSDRNGGTPQVVVAHPDAAGGKLPGRWYGYDAAEAVVVDTNDKDVMAELNVHGQALVDWVARGGHLVVAVGGNWASARDSVLGPILPAEPVGQQRLTAIDMRTLDTFAGASKSIASAAASPSVMVARLDRVEARGGKVLSGAGDVPLVVRGVHGFGRVTLVALDVDQKPFSDWPDRALFWVQTLDIRRQSADTPGTDVRLGGGGGQQMYQAGVSDLATQLRAAMEQFPGVKLIPFGWVAFFIFVYILLIGPGDYFFLKKVVKRMELTWVTFPLIVVTVSLVAYFAAYVVKGKALRVNKVDVVDIDVATGRARGSTFVNLFSPQNRDYDVRVVPVPLDVATRPGANVEAGERRSDSIKRPMPAETDVLMSWMGVPEPGFGGMGGNSRIGFSSGGYASTPAGSSEALVGVRVPIWSTKMLTARWSGPAPVVAEADLIPVGTDRLSGTVTNRLGAPLNDAIVAFNRHVYILGTLAPGQTTRVELAQDRQLSGLLRTRYGEVRYDPSSPESRVSRSDLMLALMFHDSQSTNASARPLPSNPLHYLDLTGLLALDRPMLVGRIDRPSTRLVLGNAPATPQVDQTTMVRVILPLGKPPGEGVKK